MMFMYQIRVKSFSALQYNRLIGLSQLRAIVVLNIIMYQNHSCGPLLWMDGRVPNPDPSSPDKPYILCCHFNFLTVHIVTIFSSNKFCSTFCTLFCLRSGSECSNRIRIHRIVKIRIQVNTPDPTGAGFGSKTLRSIGLKRKVEAQFFFANFLTNNKEIEKRLSHHHIAVASYRSS